MADDIKRVTYDVPAAPVKNTRRRQRQQPASKPKPVPTPTIPVAQAAGAAPAKPPAVAPTKPPVAAKPQAAGSPVPLPILATTHAVGGKRKKPSLKVALPYNNSSVAAVTTPTKPVQQQYKPRPAIKIVSRETRRVLPQPTVGKVLINPEKRKNVTLKRRFAEKRITVRIENPSKVRKTRDAIRRKVANMPLVDVSKKLHERGLGKLNSKLAEDLQRKMLVDLMMFPVPV